MLPTCSIQDSLCKRIVIKDRAKSGAISFLSLNHKRGPDLVVRNHSHCRSAEQFAIDDIGKGLVLRWLFCRGSVIGSLMDKN